MNPGARVTQKQLAELCGVDQTTISRALARSPLISSKTTRRILDMAGQVGYRPDPVLSALNAYLHAKRPISAGSVIAWLGRIPLSAIGASAQWDSCVYRAAQKRAEALGYRLDYFGLDDPRLPRKRLERILISRNVAGVILGPQTRAYARVHLRNDLYPIVAVGKSVYSPKVDQVSVDHFHAVVTCYRGLLALGYRRIGLAISRRLADRVHGQWCGGYLEECRRKGWPAPPILQAADNDGVALRKWVKAWKPDSVITSLEGAGREGARRVQLLQTMTRNGRGSLGIAVINLDEAALESKELSGVVEPVSRIGVAVVDVLVRRISLNQRGAPDPRMICLIEGTWVQGGTTSRQRHE